MALGWAGSVRAFEDAARWFLATAAEVGDRWTAPGLGEWDVRALVGHTSRSLLTVEEYLRRPASTVDVASAAEYYRVTRGIAGGPDVAERGRAAGAALGDRPADAVARIVERVLPDVAGREGGELLTTVAGGMRLSDYLPTRTFELVVHTADLAIALDLSPEPPALPALQAVTLVGDVAVADGSAGRLLLALTGCAVPLPPVL